ncbi:hypothetical protein FBULB1_13609 [Fusarium bulbicola]|nr:hypothetical protein FBULB1_13609 [Fusarium bulbicola]
MTTRIGRRRQTFGDYLNQVEGINFDNPDAENETFQLLTESKELEVQARGFRHAAQATQDHQDRVLAWYQVWVKKAIGIDGSLPEDQAVDLACFPDPDGDNFRQLFVQLRLFLAFAIAKCIDRKYSERNITPPREWATFNAMTEMMRLLQRHYKISAARHSVVNRTLLGTWEILQMMDIDIRNTPCIELAECHHLAWVLGRVAALRPGSLAQSPKQTTDLPYLVWKDLTIERTSVIGRFIVRLRIRNLKTNSIDPERAMRENRELLLTLQCPRGQLTFELSAPHRILTIAIKDEFLDKPVLLAGKKRGQGVEPGKPMGSQALTDYIQLRAQDIGFIEHVTFYSLRRNTAGSLYHTIGPEKARAIMGHDPSSVILENYYVTDRTSFVNLTAIALGEDESIATEDERPSLDLTKLNDEQLRKLGPILNKLFLDLQEADDEYPHAGTKAQKKNRDRVLRRAAWRSVLKDIYAAQTENLTIEQMTERAADLRGMRNEFNTHLLAQAKLDISDTHDRNDDSESLDLDEDFAEAHEEVPEADADTQFASQVEEGLFVETFPDEIGDVADGVPALDYATAARAAMEVWLSVGTDESALGAKPNQKIVCQLCVDDETIDEEAKAKLWDLAHLRRHQESNIHSRFKQFSRRAQCHALDNRLNGVVCEYCALIVPDHISLSEYATVATLSRHIKESSSRKLVAIEADCKWWKSDMAGVTALDLAARHDQLKRAAGWYDEDFWGSTEVKKKRQDEDRKGATIPALDRREQISQLTANLQLGSRRGWQDEYMKSAEGTVFYGSPKPLDISKLPQRQALVSGMGGMEIPAHYEPFLKRVPAPREARSKETRILRQLKGLE